MKKELFTGYEIGTQTFGDEIHQALWSSTNGARERIRQSIINTSDQQVRDALIKLGWTPPKDAFSLDPEVNKLRQLVGDASMHSEKFWQIRTSEEAAEWATGADKLLIEFVSLLRERP